MIDERLTSKGETETQAVLLAGRRKGLKHAGPDLVRDSGPRVLYVDCSFGPVAISRNPNLPTRRHHLERIRNQVDEHPFQARPLALRR